MVGGIPPLLQQIMGQQPPVSVQDIERESSAFPRAPSSAAVTVSSAEATLASTNSVPKIASPPKTVSAVWSTAQAPVVTDLESPNTAIRRSLNLGAVRSDVTSLPDASTLQSSSRSILPTIGSGPTVMRVVSPDLTTVTSHSDPLTSTPQSDVTSQLRELNITAVSSAGVSEKRGANLRIDTKQQVPAVSADDVATQLMTPQEMLDKASLVSLCKTALVHNQVSELATVRVHMYFCFQGISSR